MASPNFGMFRVPSILQTSLQNLSRSSLEMDAKAPLLSDHGGADQNVDFDHMSRMQSLRSRRATFPKQLTGELPIGCGCSFTQTIFNGKPMFSVVLYFFTYTLSPKKSSLCGLSVLVMKLLLIVRSNAAR